jgi:predicted dienelactone hydrolase
MPKSCFMKGPGTALLCAVLTLAAGDAAAEPYDPLRLPDKPDKTEVRALDVTVKDAGRGRDVPIRIYLPKDPDVPGSPANATEEPRTAPGPAAHPVVLFSHGLGGSRRGCSYLGKHWAARGYVAVFLQHPGSDESVWKDVPRRNRLAAMRQAASGRNFLLRVRDVPAVLDQLAKWNESPEHELSGRLDLERVGMSGHSFGAVTTQAVSGQAAALGGMRFTDPRIKAALALSPSTPRRGAPETAFGDVKIPWMLMTGTRDTAPIGGQTLASRRAVFPALPPGDKFELVLHDAEHSAFSDRGLPGDSQPRNPNHHQAILALSTAFWDAYLDDNAAARAWLLGDGPRGVLEKDDGWQRK